MSVLRNLVGQMARDETKPSFMIDEAGKIMGAWYKIKPENTVPEAKKVLGN
jgi:hypothetical protein